MMLLVSGLAILAAITSGAPVKECHDLLVNSGFSANFNETVAHAIHSMNLEALKMFVPEATKKNRVPTVNHDLREKQKVLPFAPSEEVGEDFSSHTMNVLDKILSSLGNPQDGLGPNWSPIERVAHVFHMWDLWKKIFETKDVPEPSEEICKCLLDVETNGIKDAVQWVANHYETGTPITLLGRPIPKLVDSKSWQVWKDRLLYYYTPQALKDAAQYLKCVKYQV